MVAIPSNRIDRLDALLAACLMLDISVQSGFSDTLFSIQPHRGFQQEPLPIFGVDCMSE